MPYDDKAFAELVEQSQDMQSDAMANVARPIDELVELNFERAARGEIDMEANQRFAAAHRGAVAASLSGASALTAVGAGAVLLGLLASPALAASSPDIQMLQTAASIEKLAVNTYTTAETLPYIGGSMANSVVAKFVSVTKSQHTQHLAAFNAATARLGGAMQNTPDPTYVPVVDKAVASLKGLSADKGTLAVVGLALELENIAAETYVNNMSLLTSANAKKVTASIMGVEAQHVAILNAVQALLKAGDGADITLPPPAAKLPAAAGSVGFPNAFYPVSSAAPATQGALA
jgi:hypothetical protein